MSTTRSAEGGLIRWAAVVAAAALTGVALSWAGPSAAESPDLRAAAYAEGDCVRCHAVPELPAAGRLDSCDGCHLWIREVASSPAKRKKAREVFPLWDRYERNTRSYLQVPSLAAAQARLEPEWVRAYLIDPHDVRPNMPETMPRFSMSTQAIDGIVADFAARQVAVPTTPVPDVANVERGQRLFKRQACATCHTFGGVFTGGALASAPDLARARERMSPDHIVAWILDPKALSAEAEMPTFGLSMGDAIALRDFLVLAEPQSVEAPVGSGLPDPTTDPVTWAQVEERVFGRICVHCHMDPKQNQGRAGPGNAGGFGWGATGIELQTYEGVRAVADLIPATLARRRAEAGQDRVAPGQHPRRSTRPDKPGMPLGLPPLSDDDTALVLGWIEQGMPH